MMSITGEKRTRETSARVKSKVRLMQRSIQFIERLCYFL